MPEQTHTIAKYAVATSLAAITLIYVFQPTFSIDSESTSTSASSRKRGVVGLSNPANDCFINSVLQALAGLGDLRVYLIRETYRRKLDGPEVYKELAEEPSKEKPAWKIEGRQRGIVTQGLKEILDALNERPIYKKTISAAGFVVALEQAFKQRISRQQQDAQEFLQVVAERLSDEYHAGQRAREHAREKSTNGAHLELDEEDEDAPEAEQLSNGSNPESTQTNGHVPGSEKQETVPSAEEEDGFPLEGISSSQIECLTCGFAPKPTASTFCSLTLNVPQLGSTTLNACFDGMFKTEHIEGFKCEKCRLIHALSGFQAEYTKSTSEKFKLKTEGYIKRLEEAIEMNPEEELTDVEMPDSKFAPKRQIDRHIRVTKFPKVLAIHLSRSIFELGNSSMKNSAKVSFPERLRLGGLLDKKMYRLLSVVCHKGSHHSGHYESFRRQNVVQPFSTPNTFHTSGVYSKSATPIPSQISTPQRRPELETSTLSSTPELLSPSTQSSSSLPATSRASVESSHPANSKARKGSSSNSISSSGPTSAPRDKDSVKETSSLRSLARSAKSTLSRVPSLRSGTTPSRNDTVTTTTNGTFYTAATNLTTNGAPKKKKKLASDSRWWRISDDKVKECKTGDVLGMQKEVYMLFYELEKEVEE
ncbi:Ubiquitin carboxyl-terminal hydrolase [Lachnellula occidentalis]|uniref:Ubiquitin carboxyl-terminal hydrolase n=1 Tax=Lachnellula occidentalis TaxID=215460 RepID=A0A8H8UFE5_9HELO|nr:Ubiquitin carboxyl-terminal hydrolase [Lachnellula occidentalis]